MVDKHRGVRLLKQDVKVYGKTLEKRLRDMLKTDKKQFGFQPGKSAGKFWSKEERDISLSLMI